MALISLWRGDLRLSDAFWLHAIIGVAVLNLVCTFLRFLVIAEDWPPILGWIFFVIPLPYAVAAIVGVWRSSQRHGGIVGATARWTALAWGTAAFVV